MIPASLPLPRISFMVVIVLGVRLDVERRRKNGFVDLSGEVHLTHEDDLRNNVPREPQVRHASHVVATLTVKISQHILNRFLRVDVRIVVILVMINKLSQHETIIIHTPTRLEAL